MQDLKIEGTKKSPEINYNSSENALTIHGRSILSNLEDDFYNPIFKLLSEIKSEENNVFTLEFHLDYFNTSSHMSIMKILKGVSEVGSNASVIWAYDSDDLEMKEIGEEMQRFCNIEFTYKEVKY